MRTAGMFVLHVEPELHVTPNCMSLDELEGCINALQDELDIIQGEARRIFVANVGHA